MKNLQLVTLDFETYYGKDYSLKSKKWNTSGYIRAEEFKVHCVAIKIGGNKTKLYTRDEVGPALHAIDWKKSALICHHTAFDGAILAWIYGLVPAFYYDTMSMTRGLHNEVSRASLEVVAQLYGVGEKSKTYLTPTYGLRELSPAIMKGLGEGCIIDTDLTHAIFKKQMEVFPVDELRLIDLTLRMFINPVLKVNKDVAERALEEELEERNWLICASGVSEHTLTSNPKFAAELKKLDVDPPMKISATTGNATYAFAQTDDGLLELLEHDDRRVVKLVAGRLAAKSTLFETRGRRLIADGTGMYKLPVMLNYCGAKTGRWSGGNKTNMQNLPRLERDADGKIIERGTGMLRLAIEAPKGHRIVVADSAQIEARTIVWLAGQETIVELFATGGDVYCHMATLIYGRQITKKDKQERFIGKIAVLGLGYGMGAAKFQTTLALGLMGPPAELTLGECQRIVKMFRAANNKIVRLWAIAEQILNDMVADRAGQFEVDGHVVLEWEGTSIWLPNGMGLHYPDLMFRNGFTYEANGKRKKIYGGLLVENIVQALARILVSDQMLLVEEYLAARRSKLKKGEIAQIALMTHDEIVSVVPDKMADALLNETIKIMRTRKAWASGVPLNAEGGHDIRYSK